MPSLGRIVLFLLGAVGVLGQDFGETIEKNQIVEVLSREREIESAYIEEFNVYRDEDGLDKIYIQIVVPVVDPEDDPDLRNVYIIDFTQYTPTLNPILDDGRIDRDRVSNCTNFQYSTTLSEIFSGSFSDEEIENPNPFFQSDLKIDDDKAYIRYTHDGPLAEFSRCETTDRDNVWSISEGENGKSKQTTIMVVNNLMVTESHDGESATYHPAFFSTTFQLTWSISQYIIVNAIVASQKRVEADLIYASVQPLWVDGKVTEDTLVHVGIRTNLENAYRNHLMMAYVGDAGSGTFTVLDGNETQTISARSTPGTNSADTPCTRHRNYNLENGNELDQGDGYYDCQQTWEFAVVLPQSIASFKEITGAFVFKLQVYQCDNLTDSEPDCGPVEGMTEQIYAEVTLDTVVQVSAEQESQLALEVTAIRSKDNSADFLTSSPYSRGIYHREDVVVYVEPTQNLNSPGVDLIKEYGITLSAFVVCIQSEIPAGTKMGCLDAAEEYRYIAYMEDDVEVSMNGKVYVREDFEDPKQSLTNHQWIPEEAYYSIEFTNLALSGRTRLYKITMVFRVNYPSLDRRRRSLVLNAEPELRGRRALEIDQEIGTLITPENPGNLESGTGYSTSEGEEGTESNLADEEDVSSGTEEEEEEEEKGEEEEEGTKEEKVASGEEAAAKNTTYTITDLRLDLEDEEETEVEEEVVIEETSEGQTSETSVDISVKSGGCEEGFHYVNIDEECQLKESDSGAFTPLPCLILLAALLFSLSGT